MSELKATPGPWTYKPSNGKLHAMIVSGKGAGGGRILAVFKKDPNPHNAELMNAAPELYQSNQELAQHVIELCAAMGVPVPQASMDRHNEASAKARGEQQ